MSEVEVRNWRDNERDRLGQTVDPVENNARKIAVSVLDGVLGD